MITCANCKQSKDEMDFHKSSKRKNGRAIWCKECLTIYNKNRYNCNRDQLKKEAKIYREAHREQAKQYRLEHREERKQYGKIYGATLRGKYTRCKGSATDRQILWTISFDDFVVLIQRSCFITRCLREVKGLDRIDSSKGYIIGNVRPSCERHNEMKNDMTDEETYQLAKEWVNWFEEEE